MEIGVVGDENHRGREHQSNEVKEEETENERRTGGGRRSIFGVKAKKRRRILCLSLTVIVIEVFILHRHGWYSSSYLIIFIIFVVGKRCSLPVPLLSTFVAMVIAKSLLKPDLIFVVFIVFISLERKR